MKKAISVIITVIGWFMVIVSFIAGIGQFQTLHYYSYDDPEALKWLIIFIVCFLLGIFIILRKIIMNRIKNGPKVRPQEVKNRIKHRWSYVIVYFLTLFMIIAATLLYILTIKLLHLSQSYENPIITVILFTICVAALLFMIMALIHTYRIQKRNGTPLVRSKMIVIYICSLILIIPSFLTMKMLYDDAPSSNILSQIQRDDMDMLISDEIRENLSIFLPKTGTAPENGEWLVYQWKYNDEIGLREQYFVGWSKKNLFSGDGWNDRKPSEKDIKKISTFVLCDYGLWTETYNGANINSPYSMTVSSEYVDIYYINADTWEIYDHERIGEELEKVIINPRSIYTVNESELIEHIESYFE